MLRIILIIILFSHIQACSTDGYTPDREFRLLKKSVTGDEAIIITRVETKSVKYNGKVFDRNFNKMNWCRGEGKKKCKDILYFNPYTKIKFRSTHESDFNYDFYSAKPGHYYLEEADQFRGYLEDWYLLPIIIPMGVFSSGFTARPIANFSTSPSGWNKKLDSPNFASFEARPSEIIYIGDLSFTFTKQKYWLKGKMNLEIEDNYDQAVRYFKANHPEYKDKLVIKRLAEPGVLLDSYNAGFFW